MVMAKNYAENPMEKPSRERDYNEWDMPDAGGIADNNQIETSVKKLISLIEMLELVIGNVETRFMPVLSPIAPTSAGNDATIAKATSPLAEQLHRFEWRLAKAINLLSSIHDRCEL